MVNLADSDTVFLVPCKHCDELLPDGERFCPICGKDQSVAAVEAHEPSGRQVRARAAKEESGPRFDLVRADTSRQQVGPRSRAPRQLAERSADQNRWVIGIAAAVVVLLLIAVVHDNFFLDQQSEAGKGRNIRANVEQVQGALRRGDLTAAESVLDELDARHAGDAGVQALRQQLHKLGQEQEAKRDRLRDAAGKAPEASGASEPAARAAPAPLYPAPPVVAVPAAGAVSADPKEQQCNEALSALALCPK